VLGCYTKVHGKNGRVSIHPENAVLAAEMGVPVAALIDTISVLPHVCVRRCKTDNGSYPVIWENWFKYQVDHTGYERVKRSRSKRRREEKREEEKRSLPPNPHPGVHREAREILEFLNQKSGARYRPVPSTLDPIVARLKSGASVSDCRAVVARQAREWGGDPAMAKYLRPSTLFRASKFEDYLGRVKGGESASDPGRDREAPPARQGWPRIDVEPGGGISPAGEPSSPASGPPGRRQAGADA
jgi:uncharacterized phage protein (TIGR02220 family)